MKTPRVDSTCQCIQKSCLRRTWRSNNRQDLAVICSSCDIVEQNLVLHHLLYFCFHLQSDQVLHDTRQNLRSYDLFCGASQQTCLAHYCQIMPFSNSGSVPWLRSISTETSSKTSSHQLHKESTAFYLEFQRRILFPEKFIDLPLYYISLHGAGKDWTISRQAVHTLWLTFGSHIRNKHVLVLLELSRRLPPCERHFPSVISSIQEVP